MSRYYTRVCNFYYGVKSKLLVKKKKTLPLHNNPEISFNKIEIITRNSKKLISLNEVDKLHVNLKTKVKKDLRLITKKKKKYQKFKFSNYSSNNGYFKYYSRQFLRWWKIF